MTTTSFDKLLGGDLAGALGDLCRGLGNGRIGNDALARAAHALMNALEIHSIFSSPFDAREFCRAHAVLLVANLSEAERGDFDLVLTTLKRGGSDFDEEALKNFVRLTFAIADRVGGSARVVKSLPYSPEGHGERVGG